MGRAVDFHSTVLTSKRVSDPEIAGEPDKWEYPWYAAWNLAFSLHPLWGMVDPNFAKERLLLMLREWYMHRAGRSPLMNGLSAM